MIRRQSLIALGIAIVLGLVAVYLANLFLSRTEQKAQAASVGMTRVAVAAVPLDYGVEVTPEKVRFVEFPKNSIPPGSFASLNQLLPLGKKRVALRPMQVNEPILASKLMGEGLNASIAALLPAGKRATAVRVNDVSGVAGFIQPSDAVDVLITRDLQSGANSSQVTDVLLQNIRVIAMDQDAKGADGKPNIARTATLEVNPVEAQKLALAQQVGSLSLVLRKPGEEENNAVVETVSLNDLRYDLYGGARLTAAAPVIARPSRPRVSIASAPRRRAPVAPVRRPIGNNVEIVRGVQGSNYEVGGYGS
jgi:pilus assembly protein CpaB